MMPPTSILSMSVSTNAHGDSDFETEQESKNGKMMGAKIKGGKSFDIMRNYMDEAVVDS